MVKKKVIIKIKLKKKKKKKKNRKKKILRSVHYHCLIGCRPSWIWCTYRICWKLTFVNKYNTENLGIIKIFWQDKISCMIYSNWDHSLHFCWYFHEFFIRFCDRIYPLLRFLLRGSNKFIICIFHFWGDERERFFQLFVAILIHRCNYTIQWNHSIRISLTLIFIVK